MNLFNYLVDGVTYSKAEYEAHVRADDAAAASELEMAEDR